MARYNDAVCRLCRREGTKLFLKGDRCFTPKCGVERRGYPPGQHGQGRARFSDFGVQLREKQKVRRMYGLLEKQFARTMDRALHMKGRTGENLLVLLERRLDNVVFRLGFAASRAEARQMVAHGHFQVSGRRVSVPSFLVRVGDLVQLRGTSKLQERVTDNLSAGRGQVPQWLDLAAPAKSGTVRSLPLRDDIQIPVQEQLIVELYSK